MIQLREYQNKSVSQLRQNIVSKKKRNILCAPTGSGKTVMFCYMAQNAVNKGKRTLIITDRVELLTQAGGTLSEFGLKPIEINSKRKLTSLNGVLYVGMAQTISRRMNDSMYQDFFAGLDLIIIDESHKQTFNGLLQYISDNCVVIGATATPYRDKNQKSLDEFYQDIVEVVKISSLINDGFLAKPNSYGVKVDLSDIKISKGDFDEKQVGDRFTEIKLYNGVFENYTKITPNKKAIIFASNIESSLTLVNDFKEKGLPIAHVDGNTPPSERRKLLHWFRTTPNAMISNVGILNAGFDCPDIDVVILYRATMSLPLFLQMVGRGSRTTENKKEFTILDFGNNIQRHGFWEQDRIWSLKKKKKKEGIAPVKECPSCSALLPASTRDCEYCGHHFEKTVTEKEQEVIVELSKMTYQQIQSEVQSADFSKLELIALAKGYKKSWIYFHLKTEKDLIDYANYKGYHQKWVDHQLNMRIEKETGQIS